MEYEIFESRDFPEEWIVEGIDYESDGEIYTTIFCRSKAKTRAESYLAWLKETKVDKGASGTLLRQSSQRMSAPGNG